MTVARAFGLSAMGGHALDLLEPARPSPHALPMVAATVSASPIDDDAIAPLHRAVVRLLPVPAAHVRLGPALGAHRVPFAGLG
jgi:hypothetical protein